LRESFTAADDTYYRAHFAHASRNGAEEYGRMRRAYVLGHLAGSDPAHTGWRWNEIQPKLMAAWAAATDAPWWEAAGFVKVAFERAAFAKQYEWRASR
jgi:hypothetical protein